MFEQQLSKKINEAEQLLRKYFPNIVYPQEIYNSMGYSLFAGGKRIRPILLTETCKLCGGNAADSEPLAAAIEMIHTYSLIHDDLPCMDDDELRRGKPTNHIVFGEAIAVLGGDALLNLAYETILSGYSKAFQKDAYMNASSIIATSAGTEGMIGGQTADIQNEGKDPDPEILDYIHRHKTGALIKASILAGATVAQADTEEISVLTVYGDAIGLMFQITDDILDLIGSTESLGKSTNTDNAHSKMTYPFVYGLEASHAKVDELYRLAVQSLQLFGSDAEFLVSLAEYLHRRNQ